MKDPRYFREDAIYLLSEIIKIKSFSKEEDFVSKFLANYIESKGFILEKIGHNLLLLNKERYGEGPTLLLNSHMDTVKPVSTWTKNPFDPQIIDGKLYGLGSNDAGASLITLLLTALNLQDKTPYNLAFCASAEEEIGGKNGISLVLEEYPNFDLALVGEPTQMQPAVAEKGLMVLDCQSKGLAGHAARSEGENAIYNAMTDIEWFKNFQFSKVSDFLGPVKMSVTQINAGTQHNVIPDQCKFVVDVRGNGCYTNKEILNIINQNTISNITARSTRLNSSELKKDHPFYQHLISLGYKPFGSPTLSDQSLMPFQSLKMGPGHSSRSHTADEYIKISELEEALVKYHSLLLSFNFQ